jgi:hypothetical protein
MGAANVLPAPLMTDEEPEVVDVLELLLLQAVASSTIPSAPAPAATRRGPGLRCMILITAPPAFASVRACRRGRLLI